MVARVTKDSTVSMQITGSPAAFRAWYSQGEVAPVSSPIRTASGGPSDQAPRIASIGEGPLDKGVPGAGSLQHALGAVAVLHVGPVDMDGEQPPVSVGQDVALATPGLLARVVAPHAPPLVGGPDELAVQDGSGGRGLAADTRVSKLLSQALSLP